MPEIGTTPNDQLRSLLDSPVALRPAARITLETHSQRSHRPLPTASHPTPAKSGISFLFFGCVGLLIGYLIFKSGYLPRLLGVLMGIAGVAYLVNSFALFVVPALADRLFPAILVPAFVAEGSLCLWLLVKGVDVSKWEARVRARPARDRLAGALE